MTTGKANWIAFIQREFDIKQVGIRRSFDAALELARKKAGPGEAAGVRKRDADPIDMRHRWMRLNSMPTMARVPGKLTEQLGATD